MRRAIGSVQSGFVSSLVLCVVFVALRGLHEGWQSIHVTNPPIPELTFFLVVFVFQTTYAWLLLGRSKTNEMS
jgi:hypothetical protein